MDDRTLLEQWGEGNRRAGSLLLERHFSSLYRFFGNKLSSMGDVEDLVQQTMTAAVEARAKFRGDASFRTFLFAIARNTLLKHLRDRRNTESFESDGVSVVDCGMGVSSAVRARREQQLLLTALRHIPIDSQVVLEMYYWEPMKAPQIAEVLGETLPAVRGRLRRAKAQLLEAIEKLASTPEELSSTVDRMDEWAESLRGYWEQ
ncbi:MAG: sigma-70 family RNA polymerase sigma factor [Myxococcota bacterium]